MSTARGTIAQLAADWQRTHVATTLRANTGRTYRTAIERHIIPRLGSVTARDLRPQHIREWHLAMQRDGVGGRARQMAHQVLRRLLGDAVRMGSLATNPAAHVSPPRHHSAEVTAWSPEQAAAFLAHHAEHPLQPLVLLAIATGLRRGEALGLRWADLDLDAARVSVRRQHALTAEGYGDAPLKTRAARREVTLPAVAVAALRALRERQTELGLTDRVFCDLDNKALSPATLHRRWVAMLDAADVPRIRWHALRHSHASMVIAGGASARVVQERLGHATVSVTLGVYGHLLGQEQRAAADAVDAALDGSRAGSRGPGARGGVVRKARDT